MENELTTLLEKKTYEEVKQIINKIQNICDGSLRQRKKKKKFHQQSLIPSNLRCSKQSKKKMHQFNLLIQKHQDKDLMQHL